MSKRSIRWIIPLLVLVVLAIAFVAIPAITTHAATAPTPDVMWNH